MTDDSALQFSLFIRLVAPQHALYFPTGRPTTITRHCPVSSCFPQISFLLGSKTRALTFSFSYLNLVSQPLKCIKSKISSDDQDPKDKLKTQAPQHCPPGHLGHKNIIPVCVLNPIAHYLAGILNMDICTLGGTKHRYKQLNQG